MKSGANEALVVILLIAVWGVVLSAIYKRQRERIDKIPVVGPVCSAIAGIFAKREAQQPQQVYVYPPQPVAPGYPQQPAYAYPPQPYSVPVPNAQQPAHDYPPVPPQMTEQPTQVVQPRNAPVPPVEDDLDDLFDKKLDDR